MGGREREGGGGRGRGERPRRECALSSTFPAPRRTSSPPSFTSPRTTFPSFFRIAPSPSPPPRSLPLFFFLSLAAPPPPPLSPPSALPLFSSLSLSFALLYKKSPTSLNQLPSPPLTSYIIPYSNRSFSTGSTLRSTTFPPPHLLFTFYLSVSPPVNGSICCSPPLLHVTLYCRAEAPKQVLHRSCFVRCTVAHGGRAFTRNSRSPVTH